MRKTMTLTLLAGAALFAGQAQGKDQADVRAARTEAQMTDDERFQLLHSVMTLPFPGAKPLPAGVKATVGYLPGIPRLGIPDFYESDGSLGIANSFNARPGDTATALPSGLALAAGFDPAMAQAAGALVGQEARARGFNVLLSGGVNLTRDPRNGRNFEYLGEDPLLAGTLSGAYMRGVQSQGVISTVKHFVLNAQETLRMTVDATIAMSALRESDLLGFQIAIEQGQPGAVMCSYNKLNGTHTCGDRGLLTGVLKTEWKYPGWVMSDWGAVGSQDFFMAGLDQQSGAQLDKQVWFDQPLKQAWQQGRVDKARLGDAVRRILRSSYAVGIDHWAPTPPVDYDAHAQIVEKAAAQGIVLLKNEGDLLPLRGIRSLVVIGGHADLGVLSGGGSSQVTPRGLSTPVAVGGRSKLSGWNNQIYMSSAPVSDLRKALPGVTVDFDSGYVPATAAAYAAHADVAIVFATQWQVEGADGSLTLPEGQDALIAAVAAANPHTIVVLETGNPVKMPWLGAVKGVVEAWYPGQSGGQAIADVLTGKVNPSGRLPMTFPVDDSQLPQAQIAGVGLGNRAEAMAPYNEGADVGYRWFARTNAKPLFPFGYGLSYSRFAYTQLSLVKGPVPRLRFTVTNTGERAGSDVPQAYLTAIGGKPELRLLGFEKVTLQPGESRSVTIEPDRRLLAFWQDGGWSMAGGDYGFAIAASATDLRLSAHTVLPSARFGH